MANPQRQERLETFTEAYDRLSQVLAQTPKEMWNFRPAPDDWTIHDILIHFADSEAHAYIRVRRIIAESGSAVIAYDEKKWETGLYYPFQSAEDALELFRLFRKTTALLLTFLPETVWTNTIYHPEHGVMTLDDWLESYATHSESHIQQILDVYAAWQKTGQK